MTLLRPAGIDPDFLELRFTVAREFAGWRADRFIAYRIPRLSRTRVQRILRELAFDQDGRPVRPSRVLAAGEVVTVYKQPPVEPDVPRSFEVIFEDEHLLAVDKPAGLPVHPTARYLRNTLTALLEERYGARRPVLTHRLDAETSGVLLCAKGIEAERRLKRMFAERAVRKTYLAVVEGRMEPRSGRIEATLGFDPASAIKVKMGCNVPDGLPALTEYSTIRDCDERSLLEVRPRTGRQHQIRAHLAFAGHPIVGDKMYGKDEGLFLEYIETGPTPELAARAGHWRQALHAAIIEFEHPFGGVKMRVESPLPRDIADLVPGPRAN